MRFTLLGLVGLMLGGCFHSPGQGAAMSTDAGPQPVATPYVFPTGIYQLTTFVDSDTCSPEASVPPTMNLSVEILDGGSASISFVPPMFGNIASIERAESDGEVREQSGFDSACASSSTTLQWWVSDQSSDSLDVQLTYTVSNAVDCVDGGFAAGGPNGNCTLVEEQHLQLVQPCPEPCQMVGTTTALGVETDRCVCDNDGG